VTADAVVVGSGPGGAAAAAVLVGAGWTVTMVEKGRNHLVDPAHPERLLEHFSNDEIKFVHRHFLGPDPLTEPRTFRAGAGDGDHRVVGEVNSIPSTVGGGGVHADGKVPRFREEDFALRTTYGPIEGASVADWPLGYDELEPYYAQAERLIGVAGDAAANPWAAWRSGPYPMPPGAAMYGATLSSAAALRAGLHPYPAPTAANSLPYDGRPACNNCGFCAWFGCPIHAKGDPVAMLQRVLASGRAELLSETFASRIVTDGRRATGVEVVEGDGRTRTIGARAVVVAAGAVETPRLLLLSGLDHPLLGRNLTVHFQTIAFGVLDHDLHAERGRAVTHVHDDAVVVDEAARRAAAEAGLPWLRGGMVEHGGPALPVAEAKRYPWGPRHHALMRSSPMRKRLWALTMQGEDLPQPTNRVDLDPSVRDARGFPVARITYAPHRHELVASAHHGPVLVGVLEEMGAKGIGLITTPARPGQPGWEGPSSAAPASRHVMGTARMGHDPRTSVVDAFGRLHGLDNVVVADSSVFVTAAGYGPTLTLVALALRAASALVGASDALQGGAVE
jgi:choline dehydrogenase-like flavoprotein